MMKLEELYKDIERGDVTDPKVAVDRAVAFFRGEISALILKHWGDERLKDMDLAYRLTQVCDDATLDDAVEKELVG
jgi:hypothetical protein